MSAYGEGTTKNLSTSPDIMLVTLSDAADFSGFGAGVYPRGFYCTTDGNIKITTVKDRTVTIPVVAHKDYLILVKRFWSGSFTAGACYAFE